MPQWKRYLPIRLGTRPVQAGPGSWVLIPGYFQVWQLAKRKVLIIYNLSVGKLARSANSRPRWSDTPYLWPAPNFSQFLTLLDPPSKSLINHELCLIFLQFCQNNKRLCIECNLLLDGVDTSKTKCYFSERRKNVSSPSLTSVSSKREYGRYLSRKKDVMLPRKSCLPLDC